MAAQRASKSFDELRLMPIQEAAEKYFCSRTTLERAINAGAIESYKPGKERLVDLDTADVWFMSKLSTPSKQPAPKSPARRGKRKR